MAARRFHDERNHVHFVTFSCYRRRTLLQHDATRRIVIGQLGSRLANCEGLCLGYVAMPDHVHALIWFPRPMQLNSFMDEWKGQSSHAIKLLYQTRFPSYWRQMGDADLVWQARHYDFNVWSQEKVEEKLAYMHLNSVRAGLVHKAVDWKWSFARWSLEGRSVGLPIAWPPGLEADDEFVVGQ